MTRVRLTIVGSLFGTGAAAWIGAGHGRPGEPVTLDGAVRSIADGVQDASDTIQDGYASARTSARNLGVEQQIAARLRQDKTIDADRIEVRVECESTAVLKGLVVDDESKDKACRLVRDTKGVLKVIDHLAVPPPPRVIVSPAEGGDDGTPAAARPRTVH